MLSLKDFTLEELEKMNQLLLKFDIHGAEPISIALNIILNKRQVFIKKDSEFSDNLWSVETNDFILESFKTKKEAINFCKRLNLVYEIWE